RFRSGAYGIGARAERRNVDVVHAVCDVLDELRPRADGASHRAQVAFVPDRPGHDRRYAMDPSRIERELGWTRDWSFEAGLRATITWYLENEPWWRRI